MPDFDFRDMLGGADAIMGDPNAGADGSSGKEEAVCRVCGCTEFKACVDESGPCWWVEFDLCSACAGGAE